MSVGSKTVESSEIKTLVPLFYTCLQQLHSVFTLLASVTSFRPSLGVPLACLM